MTTQGTIIAVLPKTTGVSKAGKEWSKMDFILETTGQYPKKQCISLFGKKVEELGGLIKEGASISANIDIESREWTSPAGKKMWITSVTAYAIQDMSATPEAGQTKSCRPITLMPPPQTSQGPVNPFASSASNQNDDIPF